MTPWSEAPAQILAGIHTVITDVDDTITHDGKLAGSTLAALERLHDTGVRIIPATAASAGWGSLMATLWPVDTVIAENGGIAFTRDEEGGISRRFFADTPPDLHELRLRLRAAKSHGGKGGRQQGSGDEGVGFSHGLRIHVYE